MRLPGYINNEMIWDHSCDVLFDGVDYGPCLFYSAFEFTPASVRRVSQTIAGRSGFIDSTETLTGYPVYDPIKATLRLGVRNPQAWIMPDGGESMEARFLANVNGKRCKITFKNSNHFYLMGRPTIKTYTKYGIVWDIVLDIIADPYWYEGGLSAIEWQIAGAASNIFDGAQSAITSHPSASCIWSDLRNGFVLRAPPGCSAYAVIDGLNTARSYAFSCRAIQGPGSWQLMNSRGVQITDCANITGTGSVTLEMTSHVSAAAACVFVDITLIDNADGSASAEIQTLDMPLTELTGFNSAPCSMIFGGNRIEIPAGNDITIRGIDIPPRTTIPVRIVSETNSSGGLTYQRGAFSCTL